MDRNTRTTLGGLAAATLVSGTMAATPVDADAHDANLPRMIEVVRKTITDKNIQITQKSHFVEDLGADSLDLTEIIMDAEQEFGAHVPNTKFCSIKSVNDLLWLVL